MSNYFSFSGTKDALQWVLALNMGWIDSPTWDSSSTIEYHLNKHYPFFEVHGAEQGKHCWISGARELLNTLSLGALSTAYD